MKQANESLGPFPWRVGDPFVRRYARGENDHRGLYGTTDKDTPVGMCPNCADGPPTKIEHGTWFSEPAVVHVHYVARLEGSEDTRATITAADGTVIARLDSGEQSDIERAHAIVDAMNEWAGVDKIETAARRIYESLAAPAVGETCITPWALAPEAVRVAYRRAVQEALFRGGAVACPT